MGEQGSDNLGKAFEAKEKAVQDFKQKEEVENADADIIDETQLDAKQEALQQEIEEAGKVLNDEYKGKLTAKLGKLVATERKVLDRKLRKINGKSEEQLKRLHSDALKKLGEFNESKDVKEIYEVVQPFFEKKEAILPHINLKSYARNSGYWKTVNEGLNSAGISDEQIKGIQKILKVRQDGKCGPETMEAIFKMYGSPQKVEFAKVTELEDGKKLDGDNEEVKVTPEEVAKQVVNSLIELGNNEVGIYGEFNSLAAQDGNKITFNSQPKEGGGTRVDIANFEVDEDGKIYEVENGKRGNQVMKEAVRSIVEKKLDDYIRGTEFSYGDFNGVDGLACKFKDSMEMQYYSMVDGENIDTPYEAEAVKGEGKVTVSITSEKGTDTIEFDKDGYVLYPGSSTYEYEIDGDAITISEAQDAEEDAESEPVDLAKANDGRAFVGTVNAIGYLRVRDREASMQFKVKHEDGLVSLQKNGKEIFKVEVAEDGSVNINGEKVEADTEGIQDQITIAARAKIEASLEPAVAKRGEEEGGRREKKGVEDNAKAPEGMDWALLAEGVLADLEPLQERCKSKGLDLKVSYDTSNPAINVALYDRNGKNLGLLGNFKFNADGSIVDSDNNTVQAVEIGPRIEQGLDKFLGDDLNKPGEKVEPAVAASGSEGEASVPREDAEQVAEITPEQKLEKTKNALAAAKKNMEGKSNLVGYFKLSVESDAVYLEDTITEGHPPQVSRVLVDMDSGEITTKSGIIDTNAENWEQQLQSQMEESIAKHVNGIVYEEFNDEDGNIYIKNQNDLDEAVYDYDFPEDVNPSIERKDGKVTLKLKTLVGGGGRGEEDAREEQVAVFTFENGKVKADVAAKYAPYYEASIDGDKLLLQEKEETET